MRGYLEGVESLQVRGWAFDPTQPDRHVQVEIVTGDYLLGTVSANLYRHDLAQGGIGQGDHAFTLNLSTRLKDEDIAAVSAKALDSTGIKTEIGRLPQPSGYSTNARRAIEFTDTYCNEEQRPVFILGSARSGTSAIAQALIKATRYEGYQEGHLLDLLAAFAVSVGKFYARKYDEAAGGRDTMVARVSRDYFSKALNRMFALLSAEVFLTPYWLDKTPNSDMIHLAPRFREIWPNAIFIFMKRRAIENLVSRERKFQAYNFTQNCREWADAMNAWLEVKNGLKLCSMEIDQIDLARHPAEIAEQLAKLLALDVNEHSRLEQALTNDRPERTSDEFGAVYDYDQLDWDQTRRQIFNERCGDLMVQFGYSRSSSYFAGI